MKHGGIMKGGVVVFDAPPAIEEGATVAVERVSAPAPRAKLTREQVLKAIEESSLQFTKSWDEIKRETR